MVWRLCVAVFLISAIILGGIFVQNYTQSTCKGFVAKLENVNNNLDDFTSAFDGWQSTVGVLSTFIERDKIIEVTSNFNRTKGFMECENWDEFSGGISELIGNFEFLMYYDKPLLRNIF